MTEPASQATKWHPAQLLQSRGEQPTETSEDFVLIVLNQPLRDLHTLRRLWHNSSFHLAADGGANQLLLVNKLQQHEGSFSDTEKSNKIFDDLDVIIGDLDSLDDETRSYFLSTAKGTEIIHDTDQYSTDFTKAVRHIRNRYHNRDIVCMGGLGGRVDQGLSQLHHLYLFQKSSNYTEGRVYLVSGESLTFLLKAGDHHIHVREGHEEVFGKHVGIIPVKEPSNITTSGLEWDVTDWPTEFGGQMSTSNHVLPETKVVKIRTTHDVLFTIALKAR